MINTFPNLQFVDRFVVCTQLTQNSRTKKKLNINYVYSVPIDPSDFTFFEEVQITCQKVQPMSDKGY